MSIVWLTARRRLSRPIVGTYTLLEAARSGIPWLRRKKSAFRSTHLPPMKCMAICTAAMIFTETTPLCAKQPYSARKPAAITWCARLRPIGLPTLITIAQYYGPYHFYRPGMVPLTIPTQRRRKHVAGGNGQQIRDWLSGRSRQSAVSGVYPRRTGRNLQYRRSTI